MLAQAITVAGVPAKQLDTDAAMVFVVILLIVAAIGVAVGPGK